MIRNVADISWDSQGNTRLPVYIQNVCCQLFSKLNRVGLGIEKNTG